MPLNQFRIKNSEVKENNTTAIQSLNGFLVFLIIMGMISTVIKMFSKFMEYSMWVSVGFRTEQNYTIFLIVYVICALIYLAGLIIIVKSKNLLGLFIVIGGLLLSTILSISLDAIFDSEIFNSRQQIMQFVIQTIFLLLALFLRSNGKSAYRVLTENFKK